MAPPVLRTAGDDEQDVSIITQIKHSPEFKKFVHVYKVEYEKLHIQQDIDEILAMNSSRMSRELYDKRQYKPEVLMDASSKDSAFRSRIVELRVKANLHIQAMQSAVTAISNYIYITYVKDDRQFSSESQRRTYIDMILKRYITEIEFASRMIDLADTIVKDIDQSGFMVHNMIECLTLLAENRGKVL